MSLGVAKLPPTDGAESVLSELYAEYRRRHPEASYEAFLDALRRGVAMRAELELAEAYRSSGLSEPAPERLLCTDELQRLLDRLGSLIMQDPLTGLFNRRYLDHRLAQELRRAVRDQRPCSLLVVDADDFKRVNDEYGHPTGDEVLRALAAVMSRAMRSTDDVSARFGGEEFVVLLPATPKHGAMLAAERLRASVESEAILTDRGPLRVTVSVGVSTFCPPASLASPEQLVQWADQALYEAKSAGKNTVRYHDGAGGQPEHGVSPEEKDALLA